ncbi:hypothetical protein [Streptomyces hainanensis]|uniref:Uncharacterized protein n=1 Tax=Streptomyces hainanensis TaxID=402648 RepID=A0A4R4TA84_9ACTN|nr:hypothetical protein [Streptomyces hainanensis]TDC74060.1 hypothetical protein E1283_17110 [Streptomyces hainanensis]
MLDAAGRQHIGTCAQNLARPDRELVGPGTDFPAALNQALERLGGAGAGQERELGAPRAPDPGP